MVLGHSFSVEQRTQDIQITEDVSFDTMLLNKPTLKGLKKAGFLRPSPVQLHGIPLGKCGFDLLLEAKSGTGKTAVFTVIALEKLDLSIGVQTVILAPTREIAYQISSVVSEIGSQYKGLNVAVVMGGLPVKDDIIKFTENVHIVVGSPGRLRHLIQDNHIDISAVRLLILDEADKLLESSFLPDINYIFSLLPKQKQVILSSATYSEETKNFVAKYVRQSQHICPDSNNVLRGIAQKVTIVPQNSNIVKQTKHRYDELKKILNSKQYKQCLIFCNYQVRVGELHRMLTKDKWPSEQLYGLQDQTDRLDALKTLQEYKCRILVSTDLAARGIDASNVDVVINFEPPFEWQTYLHRIGRAGRYGSYGTSITILSDGKEKIKFKETLLQTKIPFDLRDLWNDEPFNLGPTDNTSEENDIQITVSSNNTILQNEEKSEDVLWKTLTANSVQDDTKLEIPTFNELCDSFKTSSEPNIETFSDLMHSFQTNQNSLDLSDINQFHNSEFKQVKLENLPINTTNYCKNLDTHCTNQLISLPNDVKQIHGEKSNSTIIITNGDSVDEVRTNGNEIYLTENNEKESHKLLNTQIKSNNSDNVSLTSQKDITTKLKATAADTIELAARKMDQITSFRKNIQDKKQEVIKKQDLKNDSETNFTSPKPTIVEANFPSTSGKKKQRKTHGKIQRGKEINGFDENIDDHVSDGTDVNNSKTKKQSSQNRVPRFYNYNLFEETIKAEDDPVKQALASAGLPTAFGKVKQNKRNNKIDTYSHLYYDREALKALKPKETTEPDKVQEIPQRSINKTNSSKTFTRQNFTQKHLSTGFEVGSADSSSVSNYNEKRSSKLQYASFANSDSETTSRPESKIYGHSIEQKREKQFDAWYKQLKHHSQLIQYITYIEEMKNL